MVGMALLTSSLIEVYQYLLSAATQEVAKDQAQ